MSSEQSPRSPVLVVCDAGDAGRDLLSRRDLDLAWALTADEAEAALKEALADPSLFPRLEGAQAATG